MRDSDMCQQHKKEMTYICTNQECTKQLVCNSCVQKYHKDHQVEEIYQHQQNENLNNEVGANMIRNKEVINITDQDILDELEEQQGLEFDYSKFENKTNGSVSYQRANETGIQFKNKVAITIDDIVIVSEQHAYDVPNKKRIGLKQNKFHSCSYVQMLPNNILVSLTNRFFLTFYDASDISKLVTIKETKLSLTKSLIDFGNDDLLAYPNFNTVHIINWRCDEPVTQIITKANPIKKIKFLFNSQFIFISYKEYKKANYTYCEIYYIQTKELIFQTKFNIKVQSIHEVDLDEFVISAGNDLYIYKNFNLKNTVNNCNAVFHQNRIGKQKLFVLSDSIISILNTSTLQRQQIRKNAGPKKWDVLGCFNTAEGEIATLFTQVRQLEMKFIY